ncbi:NAD(P)H-dependent oxidoreductase [Actinoplanes sp. M2I2]|uniref:NAD(P)H-dependent oxidoreductase n=1 Tax=Actinoplanes sp. M2I2 TaxID=1734444 RepID=UPI0020206696|nr:NAD(P)H-dependent oxidoreductase [Actinoplanes sp. M2I2]
MKVHLLNAHLTYPNWSEGTLNKAMAEKAVSHLADRGHEVTVTKIEDSYDPELEVRRHLEAKLVILQTPINWFGPPWIYKRYVDEVFNAGLHSKKLLDNDGRTRSDPARQYGTGGHMHGRGFFTAATWTAPASTFSNGDSVLFEGKSVDDLLLSVSTNYKFVGYTLLENYGLYDVFRDTTDVAAGIEDYATHLDKQLAALDGSAQSS